jgi:Secretion system C-terminal sorting domain
MRKQLYVAVSLLLLTHTAFGQPACPAGQILTCTNPMGFTYDEAGNRKSRSLACTCVIPLLPTGNNQRVADGSDPNAGTTPAVVDALQDSKATITKLYPNPTSDEVTVSFSGEVKDATLTVVSQLGEQVASFQVSGTQTTVKLSDFPAGIYLFSLTNQQERSTMRVVKTGQ